MWIIIRTLKGKNSFLTGSGQWSQDRNDAECFDQIDYAVYCRDKEIGPRERRGVGVEHSPQNAPSVESCSEHVLATACCFASTTRQAKQSLR
jgi:hypothetical protein